MKASLKLDMAMIWINIWDSQSKMNAKGLINKLFKIGSSIVIVCGANINPGVLQCKNYQKWDHTIFIYRAQRS